MTAQEYRDQFPATDPAHSAHQGMFPSGACWNASQVIECDDERDLNRCRVCGREWASRCNFDEEYS